mmetsp:Transcript_18746/g.32926  ORF Transcript_18746/g.32926 Transcript_18746/m.32926 type:complete len:858 (-) Transcript_18746:364-2937(-)
MMMRTLICLLAVVGQATETDETIYVEAGDYTLAEMAETKKASMCKKSSVALTDDAKTGLRTALDGMAGGDAFLEVMQGAETPQEFGQELAVKMSPSFMISKAGPLVFTFIMLGIYLVCWCWTGCCPLCRCCKKEREVPAMFKLVAVGLLFAICAGMLMATIMAMSGFGTAQVGFEQTGCEAASLVDYTMSGQGDEGSFIGMIKVLETFQSLSDNLKQGDDPSDKSDFLKNLDTILDNTEDISNSVTLASSTMALLISMMDDPANLEPKDTSGNSLKHECTICTPLSTALTAAKEALDGGVGTALDGARSQVKEQLGDPEQLASMTGSLTEASAPLIQFKGMMHTAFGPLVKDDTVPMVLDMMGTYGTLGSVGLIMGGFGVVACGLASLAIWIRMEKQTDEDGVTKHRGMVHRCACCTWCTACYYTMFAFAVGGILTALTFPLAGMCLVLEDVDSQLLGSITGMINLNFTGAMGDMMGDMVDQCFQGQMLTDSGFVPVTDPIMLKLITLNDNGTTITMYEKVVDKTRDMINTKFDEITASMGGGDSAPPMNSDPQVVKLKALLADTSIEGMMTLKSSETSSFESALAPALKQYVAASAKCTDFTIPSGLDLPSEGTTMAGIKDFSDAMVAEYGGVNTVCGGQVAVCPDAACNAANELMDLKTQLQSVTTFKCRRFKTALGAPCDVKDMVASGATYTGDCLQDGGDAADFVEQDVYDCSLTEFTTLVQEFEVRLDKVFSRLDISADTGMAKITGDMKTEVKTSVLDPITMVADGMTCGFLKSSYHSLVTGMCYQGVVGLKDMSDAYVLCASMSFLLILVMYTVWRIAIDNATIDTWSVAPEPDDVSSLKDEGKAEEATR